MRRAWALLLAAAVLAVPASAWGQVSTETVDRMIALSKLSVGTSGVSSTSSLRLVGLASKSSETACLWLNGSGDVASGTCGTVTSVALSVPSFLSVSGSPITSSGTLAVSLASQSAYTVLARASGSGVPSFQALAKGHIPSAVAYEDEANTFTGAQAFSSTIAANGGVASSLVPNLTDTHDLGSPLKLWNQGYLAQINAVIFAETTATLFGGWSIIGKNAGSFAADVGAAATSVNFGKAMTNGQFVVVRAHDTGGVVRSEYLQITGTTGCTTCTVTRGLSTGGTGYAFAAGTPFLVNGLSGDGRIELLAYTTPRLSIVTQGASYNAQTEVVRLGYLDGAPGMGATTGKVGVVLGDASQFLRYYDGVLTIAGNGAGVTSINGGNIQTDTISANQIAANAITASEIAANAITAADILAGTITATQIAAGSITSDRITTGALEFGSSAGTDPNITINTSTGFSIRRGTTTLANWDISGAMSFGNATANGSGKVTVDSDSVDVSYRDTGGTLRTPFSVATYSSAATVYLQAWRIGVDGSMTSTYSGAPTFQTGVAWDLNIKTPAAYLTVNGLGIRPELNVTEDLGTSAKKWRDIYFSEPTTTAAAYPVVSYFGRLMAKSNGFHGTTVVAGCTLSFEFGVFISKTGC